MDEAKKLLIEARELLSDPQRWTTGSAYADATGKGVSVLGEACKFCAIGALQAAAGVAVYPVGFANDLITERPLPLGEAAYQLNNAAYVLHGRKVTEVNDQRGYGYDDMMRCYDYAINHAEDYVK